MIYSFLNIGLSLHNKAYFCDEISPWMPACTFKELLIYIAQVYFKAI